MEAGHGTVIELNVTKASLLLPGQNFDGCCEGCCDFFKTNSYLPTCFHLLAMSGSD